MSEYVIAEAHGGIEHFHLETDEDGCVKVFDSRFDAIEYGVENLQDWQVFIVVGNKLEAIYPTINPIAPDDSLRNSH